MDQTGNAGSVMNFLEEEEYDDTRPDTAEAAVEVEEALNLDTDHSEFAIESNESSTTSSSVKAPSGRRITDGNAELIRFLSKFPGATSESLSIISARKDRAAMGETVLPTVKGTEKRLRKIESLGAVEAVPNPYTKVVQHSATQLGIDSLWTFGYNAEHGTTLHKKAPKRLDHYRFIAHVAAQFTSPQGFFRDSLGIEPVPVDCLISENEMRGAYEPVKEWLKAEHNRGRSGDFGKWRNTEMEIALAEAARGELQWSDMLEARPTLLTIGQPQITAVEEGKARPKAVHQPDLAVVLDAHRSGVSASNLLVEVELSKKSWAEYRDILLTYKMELEAGFIYERVVYFGMGTQVETLLRKVDAHYGHKLFSTGKLVYLPIVDRNGEPLRSSDRIILGAR